MAQIKLQAREILRAAKRHGINLESGSFRKCPVGVLCRDKGINPISYRSDIASKLGIKYDNLVALECGFEGWDEHYNNVWDDKWVENEKVRQLMKNRYYKVGQRIAELAKY